MAIAATQNYVRYRDVWDLVWLIQQGAKLDIELVKQKIKDYLIEDFEAMLTSLLERLPVIVNSDGFKQQMERFLPSNVVERTLAEAKFVQYLEITLTKLFSDVTKAMYGEKKCDNHEFIM